MTVASRIAWLASSDAEVSQAREALRELSQPGVLDELGFLVLLGTFSDRLYPAINTIMTRARYLVFVPAIYRHLERQASRSSKSPERQARELQYRLSQALTDAREPTGVIGQQRGLDVVRPASNIYWNALGELGIAQRRMTESAYLKALGTGAATPQSITDNDGVAHLGENTSLWDAEFKANGIVSDSGEIAAGTSFKLTRTEAVDIKRRYAELRPDGGTSLLTHLLNLPRRNIDYVNPWDVQAAPPDLATVLDHARRLSLLARGATLQFHSLLFKARKEEDPGTGVAFAAWWDQAAEDLAEWDLDSFSRLPCVQKASRGNPVAFIRRWREEIGGYRTGRRAYESESARESLRSRESEIRNNKARLRSEFHLKSWGAPESYDPTELYALDYRQRVGTRFANDIANGLASQTR